MSDAVITVILTQVAAILEQQIRREVRLVTGAKKQVKKLTSEFEAVKAVIADAEKRQVEDETVKDWLQNLKDISYDTEDVLFEWITAMQKAEIDAKGQSGPSPPPKKVHSFLSLPCVGFKRVALRRDIAIKIKNINERLVDIAVKRERYKFEVGPGQVNQDRPKTASFIEVSDVEGRDVDKNKLIRWLCDHKNDGDSSKGLNVISIVGLGGIGKTTLAQLVYNSSEVFTHFNRRIWVCVSDPFDEVRVGKAILEDIEKSAPNLNEFETATQKIRSYVEGEKYLLVLDDVWTEDFGKWEQLFNTLKTGASGSAILVTTRSEKVARAMRSRHEHPLGQLSQQDSWAFFEKIALSDRKAEEYKKLERVGRMIAEKCKGLPLTLKTMGGLMHCKNTFQEWESILKSEFWEMEGAGGLFPPLMLSYYDLPSNMKRCFSFCSFFPKDHAIEAKNLIQLWMAQGYLVNSNENMEMEMLGQEYLQNLAMRSFFQVLEKDKDCDTILSVKMHDMVHDFAKWLTKNECFVVEARSDLERRLEESACNRARHLTVIRSEDGNFPTIVKNVDKLFTLWVQSFYDSPPIINQVDKIDPALLRGLSSIRALDLSRNRIGEVPNEIGNLFKLKYLNLSNNPFWVLPSSLCDLYNLQTLKLSSCDHLRNLPQEIGKLVNLRHLEIDGTDGLESLPKGIGRLCSLQTLGKFIVSRGNGNATTCGIEDLCNLNSLWGCLKIKGLGYVGDADKAKKAHLKNKKHLSDVGMDFSPWIHNGVQDAVIEALELHENVQSLSITSFGGNKLPIWMMKLINLKTLYLEDCQKCEILPPLGKLPSLATLHLEGLNGVKILGVGFLGAHVNEYGLVVLASASFPKLKKLKISKMENLEELHMTTDDEGSKIMPCLKCLKISHCSKLKALPTVVLQSSPVGKLRVDRCRLLKEKYMKEGGEEWSKISHIQKVRIC